MPSVAADDTEADIDRKMVAVVVKADQPEWFTIFRTIFHAYTETEPGQDFDLDAPPSAWDQVEKFDLDAPFWQAAKTLFGYSQEIPSLRNLLVRLVVTDFAHHLKGEVPIAFQNLVLPTSGRRNVIVCLAQWRDSCSGEQLRPARRADISRRIELEDHLHGRELDALLDVTTFFDVEKAIVRSLRDRVTSTAETIDADEVRAVASRRQGGHWAARRARLVRDPPQGVHAAYDALVACSRLLRIRNLYAGAFSSTRLRPVSCLRDRTLSVRPALPARLRGRRPSGRPGMGAAQAIPRSIESATLTGSCRSSRSRGGRSSGRSWRTGESSGFPTRRNSSKQFVRPRLNEADRRPGFVIVSDGFRYEAAQELAP